MAISNGGTTKARTGARSANDRWKSRWESWLVRSIVVAAGAHAVLFILWPVWNIARPPQEDEPLEVIQITPVAAYGGITDPGDGVIAAIPTEEEIELAREDAGLTADEEEIDETSGVELPEAAYSFVPEVVEPDADVAGGSSGDNSSMILSRLAAISPTVASLTPDIGWPQIRNPTVINRFLRRQYNSIYQTYGANGHVAVAMWVNERGAVEWAKVSESSGDVRLDDIAVSLFEEVVAFSPARSRGRGVPVQVTILVPFVTPW